MTFQQIVESGLVRRYHTEPIPITQTNSQHQWGVAVILLHIAPARLMQRLLTAALLHDVPERMAGDMPAPFKWANPAVNEALEYFEGCVAVEFGIHEYLKLTVEEMYFLKLADYMEAASFAASIYKQGVLHGLQIFHNLYVQLQGRFNICGNALAVGLFNQLLFDIREITTLEWRKEHPLLSATWVTLTQDTLSKAAGWPGD